MNRLRLPKTTVGIEIAGADLRIGVVRSRLNGLELVFTGELTGFGECSDEERRKQLREFRGRHPFSAAHVYLSLPQSAGITRQLEFPSTIGGRNKLDEVVGLQLETLSPWPLEEIYWAFSHQPPPKGSGNLTVTVVMIPKATLDPHIEFFRSVGLPLGGVSLSPAAWAEASSVLWEDATPTLILGCEAGHVEGVLSDGGKLSMAAEAGEETATLARRVVDQVLALGRVSDPEGIRLIGHGAAIGSLPEEAPLALPLVNAKPDSGRRFGAIAAALTGLGGRSFAANVLPVDLRHRDNRRQLVPMAALLLLAFAAGILLLLREPYQNNVYAAQLDAEIERVAGTVQISDISNRLDEQEARYSALAGHARRTDRNLEVLDTLATLLPESAWISGYEYQDGVVTLEGFAMDTANLQRLLEDSPLLRQVGFTAPLTRTESGRDRFVIEFVVEGTEGTEGTP